MDIPKKNNPKGAPAANKPKDAAKTTAPTVPVTPIKVPPMFRKIDWLALGIAFIAVWAVYLWTLAPELTLEDSGELCTGSFYAGIPHPPGYPFWAIYSWFWTFILPFGNVAWRVEVGESFAAAMGCGLLAFMVSRGSSMLIEGIEELKTLPREWENRICLVSGVVTGMLLGLGAFMWKESVAINRISLFGVPWLLAMILCLMRWMYAPHQRKYLYVAMLIYGWCATIHQSLLLSVPAIGAMIALVYARLGRDIFGVFSLGYLVILAFIGAGNVPALNAMTGVEKIIFHVVGLGSFATWNWLHMHPLVAIKQLKNDWLRLLAWSTAIIILTAITVFVLILIFKPDSGASPDSLRSIIYGRIQDFSEKIIQVEVYLYGIILAICSIISFWKAIETRQLFPEWKSVIIMGLMWLVGVLVYLYEPISGMTDPPMQWGYPRTVEGFFHALSRGQYAVAEGTNLFQDPWLFVFQLRYLVSGLAESFSWVYIFVGALPFLFILKMHRRERNWIIGLASIYFCLSVVLVVVMSVTADRSSSELCKVFFTASHALFAMLIGYGLTILAAYVATHYQKIRLWCFVGGGVALALAIYCLVDATGKLYFGPAGKVSLSDLPHYVIQAFAKDQYGLPVFSNLILVALPIIFLIALLVYRQRGPVFILLALFAVTPLCSGLTNWYHCEQRNHWFGYWFGHDMFTPPFTDKDGKLSYDNDLRASLLKDPEKAKLIYPEMARDTILFGGTDPGRFCPTYIIFCESFIPHYCQPKQDQKFDRRDVYIITQNALADGTYLDYLRAQYNRSQQKDPPFFSELSKYIFGIMMGSDRADNGFCNLINQSLYYVLDVPFIKWGAYVEAKRRAEGVYPPNEIYIPSPEDSQKSFSDYTGDVQARMQHDQQFPNEPKQIRPGEEVNMDNGRVQVSGQVAVMEINGLLCKTIFDNNPTNEFYVEESFPLDWMYDYETPFGVIMKINRQPVTELSDEVLNRDHEFWSKYSERLCGNWITYDTSVKEIADFVERTYIQNNYKGFIGNRAFVRDEDGQKAFSKLRSSQAGMYAWRCLPTCPPEFRQKSAASQEALRRETDFAFKQSFAFCPYSPEAVFRYINFLLQYGRFDDAIIVAEACHKLDPFNDQVTGTIDQLKGYQKQNAARTQAISQIDSMEATARTNPADIANIVRLGTTYLSMQQTNRGFQLLNQAINSTNITYQDATTVAQCFAQFGQISGFQTALQKMISLAPDRPEPRYQLAEVMAVTGHSAEALADLKIALDLNRQENPANNMLSQARSDPNLNNLRNLPEFQKLISSN
jgi:tetratricopeptide (TPR) repeat protein